MIKGVIFDFDGVIAESVSIKTDAFATLYKSYGEEVINKVIEHHELNGGMSRFKKIKFYHESFIHKKINEKEIEALAEKFSNLVVNKVINAPYVLGVIDYIKECSKKYTLFISTGTPTDEIKKILKGRGLSQYFTKVYGSPESKTVHLRRIIAKYGFNNDELLFYGDSNSDIMAAKNLRIPFILIKNSFNKSIVVSFQGKIINNFMELL
ncbi:HAD-IA family hydrolase [Candidatus Marinimicrobia bacterium]|nr:HAD-IA family hydrolase [Candidatus Neomarinimicrobiota bacterium]